MKRNRYLLISLLLFLLHTAQAQDRAEGDFMRSIGKIYVVVAVIVTVFIGIVLFLIFLDRKLTKLENQIQEEDV